VFVANGAGAPAFNSAKRTITRGTGDPRVDEVVFGGRRADGRLPPEGVINSWRRYDYPGGGVAIGEQYVPWENRTLNHRPEIATEKIARDLARNFTHTGKPGMLVCLACQSGRTSLNVTHTGLPRIAELTGVPVIGFVGNVSFNSRGGIEATVPDNALKQMTKVQARQVYIFFPDGEVRSAQSIPANGARLERLQQAWTVAIENWRRDNGLRDD
jgi:hypothetical protein